MNRPTLLTPAETADVLWFIPTHGDGRYLGSDLHARAMSLDYLGQIARAADACGYFGVLLPTGRSCEDSWVVASALVPLTRHLRFLVAVRPGLMQPSLAARMAATLDRLSEGRTLINVVTGGDPREMAGDGLFLDHATRYAVTDEFLTIWRRLMGGETVTWRGEHLAVEGARLLFPPIQSPYPPLYFGGSSSAGQEVASTHCDVYLTWGEPLEAVREKLAAAQAAAVAKGRRFSFGIRLHVIVRESSEEAWAEANRLISQIDDKTIAAARASFGRFDSEGQRRMAALHDGRRDRLLVGPNLWAGIGLVRGGAGTALVGNPQEVAERMREYMTIGIDRFILSGYPHLEECYRFAELVFPLLPLRASTGVVAAPAHHGQPFGEIVSDLGPPSPGLQAAG